MDGSDPAPVLLPRLPKWHVANGSDLCPTCRGIGTHLDSCSPCGHGRFWVDYQTKRCMRCDHGDAPKTPAALR